MSGRRDARQWAVQLLFQQDFNPSDLDASFRTFWEENPPAESARAFAEELVRGVLEHRVQIDSLIQSCTQNWDIARMGAVERNVMRMAVYEMCYRDDIPPAVSIDEALEITKGMSEQSAGRFVNGILDQVRIRLQRPSRSTSNAWRTAAPDAPPPVKEV